jgi:hypothetical protein
VNFEAFLLSKKIDPDRFRAAEKEAWESWKLDFEEMHPASFASQKLFLINPIRRKYPISRPTKDEMLVADRKDETLQKNESESLKESNSDPTVRPQQKPSVAKPVIRPKPKMS